MFLKLNKLQTMNFMKNNLKMTWMCCCSKSNEKVFFMV